MDQSFATPRYNAVYIRPKNALDVDYRLLVSTDGENWNENGDVTGVVYSREISVESIAEDLEKVILALYPDTTPPPAIVLRLTATIF